MGAPLTPVEFARLRVVKMAVSLQDVNDITQTMAHIKFCMYIDMTRESEATSINRNRLLRSCFLDAKSRTSLCPYRRVPAIKEGWCRVLSPAVYELIHLRV